jgi:hypothetical protein
MNIVKNLQENVAGNLECEILNGESWIDFVMSPSDEHEIHESSDWQGIKPCDQAEKDAYKAGQKQAESIAYLNSTDWYLTRMLETGQEVPLDIAEARNEARKLL